MTTFLFWNLNRKNLQNAIANLAWRYEVDVLMFAECAIEPSMMLRALNSPERVAYHYAPSFGCERIKVFTRFPSEWIRPVHEEDALTIRHLQLPGLTSALLAITHLSSKIYWSEQSQALACVELANAIRDTEKRVGHERTVLVGDLNMNPFEDGIVSANGLHGVVSRSIASKRTRMVQSKTYPFFYNPMWNLLGDETTGPPGTYYYSRAEPRVFFWNTFDQVLIRPDLLPAFNIKNLAILTEDGNTSFMSEQGTPNTVVASDHFPLLFSLIL